MCWPSPSREDGVHPVCRARRCWKTSPAEFSVHCTSPIENACSSMFRLMSRWAGPFPPPPAQHEPPCSIIYSPSRPFCRRRSIPRPTRAAASTLNHSSRLTGPVRRLEAAGPAGFDQMLLERAFWSRAARNGSDPHLSGKLNSPRRFAPITARVVTPPAWSITLPGIGPRLRAHSAPC